MKLAKCGKKGITSVSLKDEDNNERTVTILSEIFDQIISFAKPLNGSIDLAEQLLSAPKLCYTINAKEMVTSVSRIR